MSYYAYDIIGWAPAASFAGDAISRVIYISISARSDAIRHFSSRSRAESWPLSEVRLTSLSLRSRHAAWPATAYAAEDFRALFRRAIIDARPECTFSSTASRRSLGIRSGRAAQYG